MVIKKIMLLGIIGITAFASTTAFARHHAYRHHPRIKFFHHHHRHHVNPWRNTHRHTTPGAYVAVPNGTPYSRNYHQHY